MASEDRLIDQVIGKHRLAEAVRRHDDESKDGLPIGVQLIGPYWSEPEFPWGVHPVQRTG